MEGSGVCVCSSGYTGNGVQCITECMCATSVKSGQISDIQCILS